MLLSHLYPCATFEALTYCRLSPGSGWKGWKANGEGRGNFEPQFCYTSFLLLSFTLRRAASLDGTASTHTWNSKWGLKRTEVYTLQLTGHTWKAKNLGHVPELLPIKGLWRPRYSGEFLLSLLPSTTPNISIKKMLSEGQGRARRGPWGKERHM